MCKIRHIHWCFIDYLEPYDRPSVEPSGEEYTDIEVACSEDVDGHLLSTSDHRALMRRAAVTYSVSLQSMIAHQPTHLHQVTGTQANASTPELRNDSHGE